MTKVIILGLNELKDRVNSASKNIQDKVNAEVAAACLEYVSLAKRDLASQGGDRGTLLNSIGTEEIKPLQHLVFARTFYAAFIEFGTKSKFNPYPGTEEYASQFKGAKQNGSIKLIDAIKGWVKRKGIGDEKDLNKISYLIARSIYKNGINAKPFFFKQIPIIRDRLIFNVTQILNDV